MQKKNNDTNDTIKRTKYGEIAGIFGIITNLFLGIIKLVVGFFTNSVSIMADAVNNVTDSVASFITIVGFKLSGRKPSPEHPYGYARYEYVSGLLIALFMFLMGLVFAVESSKKIFMPEELSITTATFIVLIIAVIGKVMQMLVYKNFANKINSDALRTTAVDTRNDIISTSAILISMVVMKIFNVNIDGYLGIGVSGFVLYSGITMIREMLEPIIGSGPSKEQISIISKEILSYECVEGIHDLVIHNYGVNNDFVTVHVEIDSKMDMLEAHDLIDNIEREVSDKLNINLTIHMDPVEIGNSKVDKLKNEVLKALKGFDENLDIHDFRIVEGPTHTNILFDCVIPYDKDYTINNLKKVLRKRIKPKHTKYYYVIEIDRPYY